MIPFDMIQFIEHPSPRYKERTIENTKSDITIAFAVDFNSFGEILTHKSCISNGGLYIPIDLNKTHTDLEYIRGLIIKHIHENQVIKQFGISVNIAGNGIYTLDKYGYTQEYLDKLINDFLCVILNPIGLGTEINAIISGGQTGIDESGAKFGSKNGYHTIVRFPKGWMFRDINGKDICDEKLFKSRFE